MQRLYAMVQWDRVNSLFSLERDDLHGVLYMTYEDAPIGRGHHDGIYDGSLMKLLIMKCDCCYGGLRHSDLSLSTWWMCRLYV